MSLDERANRARAALLDRAHHVAMEHGGLPSHRPRRSGLTLAVAAVAVIGVVIGGLAWIGTRGDSTPASPTPLAIDDGAISHDDDITAALISSQGDVIVLVHTPAGLVGRRVRVDAGVPLTDRGDAPGPRWMPDGRTIEFVAESNGDERVVRVDIYTGRTATQPYGAADGNNGDGSTLPLDFVRGADGSAVRLVSRDGTRWWRFSSIRDNTTPETIPFDDITPLAPAPDGVVVATENRVAIRAADGSLTTVDTEPVAPDDITAAAYAPGPELVLGTRHGMLIRKTERIATSTGWPITTLAWSADFDRVIAESSTQDRHAFQICDIAQRECTDIDPGDASILVRGTATQPAREEFAGIWPETTPEQLALTDPTTETWRLEPEAVAYDFAREVLGWPDPTIGAEQINSFAPWITSFDVAREPDGPTVNVRIAQLGGDRQWVVIGVSSPTPRFESGYQGNEVSVAFDPMDAASTQVTINIDGEEHTSTATRGDPDYDSVTIALDGGIELPASALVLLEDDQGQVFAAYSATFGDSPASTAAG